MDLLEQLECLAALPRNQWRRRRLLEYVCRFCGHTLLEVMQLQPNMVLRYSTAQRRELLPLPIDALDGADIHLRRTAITPTCACRQAHLLVGIVLNDLAAGVRKRALPTPREPWQAGWQVAQRRHRRGSWGTASGG